MRSISLRGPSVVPVDADTFLAAPAGEAKTLDDYLNHGCDGSLWMASPVQLVSRREITAGEELTADYALWLSDESYVMRERCKCGSDVCRGVITGKDWRRPDVRARYLGHCSPFLNSLIQNEGYR